jgi:dihydroflavonol-4-reductase
VRVLVTGATGFVGGHIARAAAEAGHEVVGLVRSEERLAQVSEDLGSALADSVVGDMTDEGSVRRALAGCDAVVHAAAVVSLQPRRATEMLEANVRGAELVLGAGVERGLDPVIHVSSVSALFRPGVTELTTDLEPAQPTTAYGMSKVQAERVARRLQDEGRSVTIFYPGGVLGPGLGGAFGETGEAIAQQLRSRVLPAATGRIGIVDVRDVAAAVTAALEPREGPRRYLCGGHHLGARALSRLCAHLTGRRMIVVPFPASALRGIGAMLDVVVRIVPLETMITREAMIYYTQLPDSDDSGLVELGISLRPPEDTIADTIRSLHRAGRLTAAHAGALAGDRGDG